LTLLPLSPEKIKNELSNLRKGRGMKERQQRENREGRESRRDSRKETFPQGFHTLMSPALRNYLSLVMVILGLSFLTREVESGAFLGIEEKGADVTGSCCYALSFVLF
jgi:hypothetical protein